MKISVIIPTYKPKGYIFDCLNSLKEQTLDRRLFEIIIILNGSKDPYFKDINNYLINDMVGYHYSILHVDKSGVSTARNIGIKQSRGEYIAFLDDDDMVSPPYLEGLLSCVGNNSISVSNVLAFTESPQNTSLDYLGKCYQKYCKLHINDVFRLRSFLSTACCKLIPRSIIGDRCFSDKFKIGEDALFMFLLSDRIKRINLSENSDVVYYRRFRSDSASRSKVSFFTCLKNVINLILAYSMIFMSKPFKYSFTLYLSRIIATIIKS